MRWGFSLVALLLALVTVLVLSSRHTQSTFETLRAGSPALPGDATPRAFDERAARALLLRLSALASAPAAPRDELQEAATTAASWTAASAPGSREYRVAVKLRGAADSLLASAEEAESANRAAARRLLDQARAALAGDVAPNGPVEGIRDQLENLQDSRREQYQEVEKETK